MRELIHTEEREGFTLHAYRHNEDISPVGEFATGDDEADTQTIADIESGALDWFAVEVTASKASVELASDWLGACCYASAADFVTAGDYYDSMCAEAVSAARAKLAELCAEVAA